MKSSASFDSVHSVAVDYSEDGEGNHSIQPITTFNYVATAAGMTKTSISKALLTFKDSIGLRLTQGKRGGSRDIYRRAQKAAVKAGVHSSQVAKRNKAPIEAGAAAAKETPEPCQVLSVPSMARGLTRLSSKLGHPAGPTGAAGCHPPSHRIEGRLSFAMADLAALKPFSQP